MAGKKKSASSSAAPSQRMLRVAELIRHRLAEMLTRGEIHDDVLAGHVVTVPEVRLSPDLKLATVYVMPLGGDDTKVVLEALTRNKKYIRAEIAHYLGGGWSHHNGGEVDHPDPGERSGTSGIIPARVGHRIRLMGLILP